MNTSYHQKVAPNYSVLKAQQQRLMSDMTQQKLATTVSLSVSFLISIANNSIWTDNEFHKSKFCDTSINLSHFSWKIMENGGFSISDVKITCFFLVLRLN